MSDCKEYLKRLQGEVADYEREVVAQPYSVTPTVAEEVIAWTNALSLAVDAGELTFETATKLSAVSGELVALLANNRTQEVLQ